MLGIAVRQEGIHGHMVTYPHPSSFAPPVLPMQKVTVIIPCYDVEAYIGECLDSVLAQGPVVEVVYCVDNGSKDGTVQAIERWRAAHPELRVVLEHEPVKGASAARNRPLTRVATPWIQFLDADDLLLPGKISHQLEQCAGADVLYESATYERVDGTRFVKVPDDEIEVGLMAGNLGNTCANLWSTAKLNEVEGWDQGLPSSQEYDLMLRLYEAEARFKKLDGDRTVVRERSSGQISQGAAALRWRTLVDVQLRMLRTFKKRAPHPDRYKRIQQAFFGGLRMLYPHDPEQAVALWERYLKPSGFEPRLSDLNTNGYIWAYRLLGFPGAERMKKLMGKARKEA